MNNLGIIYSTSEAEDAEIGTYGIFSNTLALYEKEDLVKESFEKNNILKLISIYDRDYPDYEHVFCCDNGNIYKYFKPVLSKENKEAFNHYMKNGAVKDNYGNIYDLNSEEKPDWLKVTYTKAWFSDLIKICKNTKNKDECRIDGLNLTKYTEYCSWRCLNEYFSAIVNLTKFLEDNKITKFLTKNTMSNFKFGLKHHRNFDELYDKYVEYVKPLVKSIDEILKFDDFYISYIKEHIYGNMYSDLYNFTPDKYLKELGFDSFLNITESNDNFRKFNKKLYEIFIEARNDNCLNRLVDNYNKSIDDMIEFLNYNHFYKLLTHSEMCKILVETEREDINNLQKFYKRFVNVYVNKYIESYDSLIKYGNFDNSYIRIYKNLEHNLEKLFAYIPDKEKTSRNCPDISATTSPITFCSTTFRTLNNFVKSILTTED